MSVLCIAEINESQLVVDPTARAIAAASAFGEVTVLVCGPRAAAELAAALPHVARVLFCADASYAHGLAEPIADLIVSIAPGYDAITAPATTSAKNILPRVAGLLDVMIIPDVIELIDTSTFKRPIYAGNAIQTVRSSDAVKVMTLRVSAFSYPDGQSQAPVEQIGPAANPGLSVHLADDFASTDRPEATAAKVVVAGGRGVGSKENFEVLERLADKLGAALGASRAAVDAGYAPNDWQIGQTGKIVAPDFYIAVGISGAIQHLAGMKDSKVIVAINRDEAAPIFQVADFGLVGDLFDIVPELTAKL